MKVREYCNFIQYCRWKLFVFIEHIIALKAFIPDINSNFPQHFANLNILSLL